MLKLFTEHVKGEEMYGLTIHAVMRITESVRKCRREEHRIFFNVISCFSVMVKTVYWSVLRKNNKLMG